MYRTQASRDSSELAELASNMLQYRIPWDTCIK